MLARHPELLDGSPGGHTPRTFVPSITMAVALAVMLLAPSTGYWPLLLLVVADAGESLWRRLTGRRRTA
jgi:hypothetical protein